MKKKNVLNLIKYHSEKNDFMFRNEAIEIAKYFDNTGDYQLSEYIMGLLSETNTFSPQVFGFESEHLKEIDLSMEPLWLPEVITDDIKGIVNAVSYNVGINKFLFEGKPGTGKTESVKHIARLLERKAYIVNFSELIDSKLGQTSKNIVKVFDEINRMPYGEKSLVLFDEIDGIALDRINPNDLREMGRATTTMLTEISNFNPKIVLIATTNLYASFDKSFVRRFDSIINFNRYTDEDLVEISANILQDQLNVFKFAGRDIKLFKKIFRLIDEKPYPGELKNIIRSTIAFSNPNDEFDYLKRMLVKYTRYDDLSNLKGLYKVGFTLRELEILTGISRSQASRIIQGGGVSNEE